MFSDQFLAQSKGFDSVLYNLWLWWCSNTMAFRCHRAWACVTIEDNEIW